jgi:hypothetical protein
MPKAVERLLIVVPIGSPIQTLAWPLPGGEEPRYSANGGYLPLPALFQEVVQDVQIMAALARPVAIEHDYLIRMAAQA